MRRSAFWCWLLAGALLSCTAELRAQVAPSGDAATSNEVRIWSVGHADEWAELEQLLREFLAPHGLVPKLEARASVGLLDRVAARQGASPSVWVELISSERARVALGDAERGRYLLRDVPLTNGLDAIGRETLAQVIESSLLALRGHDQTLSRDQVERLLAEPTPLEPATAEPVAPVAAPAVATRETAPPPTLGREPPQPARPELATSAAGLELSARYLAHWTGSDLGLLHGPAASVAWGTGVGSGWLGAALTGEQRFAQSYTSQLVGFSLRSRAAWLTARGKLHAARDLLVVGDAGAGLTWTTLTTRAVSGGLAQLAPEASDTTVWLRAALGVEQRFAVWSISLAALVDASVHDTHYDVTLDGSRRRWVTPWRLSPGLSVALGFCP